MTWNTIGAKAVSTALFTRVSMFAPATDSAKYSRPALEMLVHNASCS